MDLELDQFRDVDLVIDRANDSFIQRQFVSQGDYKGRSLTVQVTNNGSVGEVAGLTLNLKWHNEASGLTDLSAFTILDKTNSIFRIEYPEHMMTPGKVIASIQVIQNGKVTNLKQFELTVQKLAGQAVGIVEKAEFSALVAVLADSNKFRTDIDALEADKADKIDLAQTNENIENLDSTKADKTALAQTNANMATNLATKVDKEGNEQVTLRMLSQEVKTAMTGGSVAVIGPNGVNTSNIVDGAVTDKKVSAPILKAMLIPHIIPPNYDTTTKTLSFNGVTGSQDIITWGNGNYTTNSFLIPVGTKVINSTETGTISFKLVFDISTKLLSFESWAKELNQNQIAIVGFRHSAGKIIISADFPITVDGYPSEESIPKLPLVTILSGGSTSNRFPNLNSITKTLNFPGGFDWIFSVDGKTYTNAIPSTGLTVDLSNLSGTSAWYLVFNLSTKAITVIPYSTLGNYVKGYAILGSLRIMGVINGVSQFSLFLPYPFLVDGKLYGYSSGEGSKNISVSLDAPVKCIHHRGYSLKYPENTLLAYRKSKTIGVNEVEMDLSWTSDNIPVDLHDDTINRTARDSDGNPPATDMKISEITLAQAREYEYGSWKGAEFKGEKLPTFEDCVIQCKALNQRLHVDRAFLLTEDKLEILDTILTKYDFYNIVWYINSKTSGDLIRAKYPNATLAYLLFSDVTQGAIDVCKQLNLEAAKCIVFPQADLITEVNVDLALSENIEVHVWNADNLNRYTLISMGVSGISTDFANIQEELL